MEPENNEQTKTQQLTRNGRKNKFIIMKNKLKTT